MQDALNKYTLYVKLTVLGESPEDALDYAADAVDTSDLLSQDGVVGIEILDDLDTIELVEEADDFNDEWGTDEDE